MRAIRYGDILQNIVRRRFLCRNPLCVQLDMEFGLAAVAGVSLECRNPLCVQLDME